MTFCTYPIVSSILKLKLDMLLAQSRISICTLSTFLEKYRSLLLLTNCAVLVFFRFSSFSVPVTSVSVPGIDPECSVCCFYRRELFHFCHFCHPDSREKHSKSRDWRELDDFKNKMAPTIDRSSEGKQR